MVSNGLVSPIVSTTSKSATPAVRLRGILITGDSCEILSRPENARNEPAKPTRIEIGVSLPCPNISENIERNCARDMWVKTVTRIAISLRKAIVAPTRLTFALSLTPIQLSNPNKIRTTTVTSKSGNWIAPNMGRETAAPSAGSTTLRYCIPDRLLIDEVRK